MPWSGLPVEDRYRRLHLLPDAYGHDDRPALQEAVATRGRRNAEVTRQLADGGDPVFQALRGQAADLDRSVQQIDELPEPSGGDPQRTSDLDGRNRP